MVILRWVLIVWSTIALLIFLSQPFVFPVLYSSPARWGTQGLTVLFYVLNLVFLWRARPAKISK
jgi:prepilin signal peptidase PulO-like enzyme (type II secretory pathway)